MTHPDSRDEIIRLLQHDIINCVLEIDQPSKRGTEGTPTCLFRTDKSELAVGAAHSYVKQVGDDMHHENGTHPVNK